MTANNHHRRTRIVATLGPASSTPEQIVNLAKAGVNVFRLNFSHGSHDEHAARHKAVREAEAKVGHPLAVLADFQGPKLRVGVFENGPVMLKKGQKFRLDLDKAPGNDKRVNLPHPEIISAIDVGHRLLLDDGKMALKVLSKDKNGLETEVLVGGKLSERKGVNVPDVALPIPALTEKDHKDFKFALSLGVDIVALSFVQKPEDIQEARDIAKGQAWIVTKLEKPQAVDQLEEIIRLSDALMVARGDLGVELPAEEVPVVQKRAIKEARRQGRPVIVATQMLESMIDSPSPTRAEVSDVANAVYDGADAVMLSAESAAGGYGLDAVSIMARTVSRVERDADWRARMDNMRPVAERSIQGSQAKSAGDVARHAGASALAVQTEDGRSAVLVSRERPHQPIVALTNETTARRLSVVWGVFPKAASDKSEIASSPVVKSGDHVVLLDSSKALSVVKV
ncbi:MULTISPECIES: pyruvate kinase [unclassified Saccharibacter]|uniref:pyruvate kinase n=1 Tax=unclassified Saccharibacter TaxID=2648722 RepID=UPI00132B88D5|nr:MULTISPECIES: pyruvate kinase [unclassified Saccharibacter]MXV36251.1 pyruvate kinase [Saccharibacter sp. EH611]MXV57111.1 pyruvate kinase [Saccharibacter sp. EH70]MXV66529.1 pyruvate kinase [Saccharibacter sp. EH60]